MQHTEFQVPCCRASADDARHKYGDATQINSMQRSHMLGRLAVRACGALRLCDASMVVLCRSVVMVPDPNMEHKETLLADEVLSSLQNFDPSHWGLPAFSE